MEIVTNLEGYLFGVLLLASAAFFTVATFLPGGVRGTIQFLVCSVLLWVSSYLWWTSMLGYEL